MSLQRFAVRWVPLWIAAAVIAGGCDSAGPARGPAASATPASTTVAGVTDSAECDVLASDHGTTLVKGWQAPSADVAAALSYSGPYKVDLADIFTGTEAQDRTSVCIVAGYPSEWGDTSGYAQLPAMATMYVVHHGTAFVLVADVAQNLTALDLTHRA